MYLLNVILVCNHIRSLENFCNTVLECNRHHLVSAFKDWILEKAIEGRSSEGLHKKVCVFVCGKLSKEDLALGGVSFFSTSKIIDNLHASLRIAKWISSGNLTISKHIDFLSQQDESQWCIIYVSQSPWFSVPSRRDAVQVSNSIFIYTEVCGTDRGLEYDVMQYDQPGSYVLNFWHFFDILSNKVQGGLESYYRGRSYCLIVCILNAINSQGICCPLICIFWYRFVYLAVIGEIKIPRLNKNDFVSLKALVNFEGSECNTRVTTILSLHYWNSGGFYFLFSIIRENNTVMDINLVIIAGCSFKRFPCLFWCINLIENSMETFQSSACINIGSLQIVSPHQIPYNLQYTFTHTYFFLFVILKIMSTSGQNNAPNAATQNSPFNSETLDYCLVGRLLSNKPVYLHTFKTRMESL